MDICAICSVFRQETIIMWQKYWFWAFFAPPCCLPLFCQCCRMCQLLLKAASEFWSEIVMVIKEFFCSQIVHQWQLKCLEVFWQGSPIFGFILWREEQTNAMEKLSLNKKVFQVWCCDEVSETPGLDEGREKTGRRLVMCHTRRHDSMESLLAGNLFHLSVRLPVLLPVSFHPFNLPPSCGDTTGDFIH